MVRARERVGQQLLDIGTLLWPLLLTIPDGVCRESDGERASDCERLRRKGSGLARGQARGPTTTTRLLSLDSARLDSPLRREDPRLGSAQARRPTAGWLAGWVGLAHREPTGPPTATIHRNRAPSNPSDSHSSVYELATATENARGGGGGERV